ncbi:MAG TPA: DUF6264 family protein [Microbacterium sp.]|nr:DUF6264 family protein [Microbacterium sp.]
MSHDSAGTIHPAPPQKAPFRVVDIVVSTILMVLGGIVIAGVAFFSLFLSMMSDGCGADGACNYDLLGAAFYAALLVPPLVYLGAVVWGVVRMVQRRLSWWVPIVGLVAAFAVWGVAVWLMSVSVGG